MSVTTNYTVEDAIKLLADLGGYDPVTEAEDLFAKAKTSGEYDEFLERRINEHEPVAYITSHCKFRGLNLYIDKRVLIPRTETEPLVEIAIDAAPHKSRIIDVGTGSGSVALAVKNERPDLYVKGVDISKDALDVAAINSAALDLNVHWQDADLLNNVKGDFNMVLANMPYLPTKKRDTYAVEMTEHEPQVALWGGEDGYDLIRRLLVLAAGRNTVELIALEVGLGQETDVCELVRSAGFPIVFCTTDKKGDIRAVIGKR